MTVRHTGPAGRGFRILALTAAVLVVVLIGTGSRVRVSDSGEGCPDWPLCHGHLLPPLEFHSIVEWTHRFTTSVVVWPVLALAVLAWRRYRARPEILAPALAAPVLLAVQITLGALVVVNGLPDALVAVHMANAMLVLGSLAVVAAASLAPYPLPAHARERAAGWGTDLRLAYLAAGTTYAQIVLGAVMVHIGASSACWSFPLCADGTLVRPNLLAAVHMAHRGLGVLAALAAVAVLWHLARAGRREYVRYLWTVVALFVVQIALGAGNVLFSFPEPVDILHLAVAATLWAMLVGLSTALTLRAREGVPAAVRQPEPEVPGTVGTA